MPRLYHGDCMAIMATMADKSVDFTLTDIPYNAINKTVANTSQTLRKLDKGKADDITFDLGGFLEQITRLTKNSLIIFCAKEQFSTIFSHFSQQKGTTRAVVWHKSNPSPMNGQHVYLSGVELAVWFKFSHTKTFNAFCKNTVFKHPNGTSKHHPTEKNHALIQELLLDNTDLGQVVFDPCMGSGSHLMIAKRLGRDFIGIELDREYFLLAQSRIEQEKQTLFSPS